ncbi:hypothetical protein FA15DRAFT_547792, partial [Coprinopsis marcescibilis]
MLLVKGTPTLQHKVTGRWTRPDNVFGTHKLDEMMLACEVNDALRPPGTDHLPIITEIDLTTERTKEEDKRDFRETDWDEFREKLEKKVEERMGKERIENEDEFEVEVDMLTNIIQETIAEVVPWKNTCPRSKRWWGRKLKEMKQELNRARNEAWRFRAWEGHEMGRTVKRLTGRF